MMYTHTPSKILDTHSHLILPLSTPTTRQKYTVQRWTCPCCGAKWSKVPTSYKPHWEGNELEVPAYDSPWSPAQDCCLECVEDRVTLDTLIKYSKANHKAIAWVSARLLGQSHLTYNADVHEYFNWHLRRDRAYVAALVLNYINEDTDTRYEWLNWLLRASNKLV